MIFFKQTSAALLVALIAIFSIAAPANAIDASDRPEIEKIIREYLLNNPQILGEMQAAFEANQKVAQAELQKKALSERADLIFSSPLQVEIGNKDAKYKIVEFYDYNCPFCQRALGDMEKILDANPDVKFVIKEWPVLGEKSYQAHVVSIAFAKLMPNEYPEFHKQLLNMRGSKGENEAIQLALMLGADESALRTEMSKPYVLETMRENNMLADSLGITGTPSYVIGDQVVFGAVGFDQITAHIKEMKK